MKPHSLIFMISIVCSIVLSSCGVVDSTAFKSKALGIHTQSVFKFRSTSKATRITTGSPNGFHPASVSESVAKKSRSYRKDKHGMATYPDSVRSRMVRTTSYSHEENEVGAPWRKNAIGTYLKYGSVRSAAADWSRYPVGTKFKIKGLPHTYIVDDYGSSLVGTNTIDIYHPNLSSMRRWGTRPAQISVIQWGDWDRTINILAGRTKYPHTRKMYYAAKAKVKSGQVTRN
ncbi:3D domain-containing protein [Akkermansiaceae bacterium]|nr:3D domain-containing protein [Akkermansiaceae bacterium]